MGRYHDSKKQHTTSREQETYVLLNNNDIIIFILHLKQDSWSIVWVHSAEAGWLAAYW